MREVTFTLDKLNKGLRPYDNQPMNGEYLTALYNLKPGAMGLEAFDPLTSRIGALSINWPYPQLFVGTNYRFICTDTKVYEVDSS